MLLAAQSMAVGTVLVRYVTKYADPIMATGYHMLLGGIPLLILSAQQESSELAERLPLLTGRALLTLVMPTFSRLHLASFVELLKFYFPIERLSELTRS